MDKKNVSSFLVFVFIIVFSHLSVAQSNLLGENFVEVPANIAQEKLSAVARNIPSSALASAATQQGGRLKPFNTLSRESLLFITGKYSRLNLSPEQLYLSLVVSESSPWVQLIEVRDKGIRTELGFLKSQRYVSAAELEATHIEEKVQPYLEQQRENSKSLSANQKAWLELYSQLNLQKNIIMGNHLIGAMDFSHLKTDKHAGSTIEQTKQEIVAYLKTLKTGASSEAERALVKYSRSQEVPQLFQHALDKLETEVLFNKLGLFFWTAILYIVLAALLLSTPIIKRLNVNMITFILTVPLIIQILGLSIRVYITQFAPITNMYGTMLWVSFGVNLFSLILYRLYKNTFVSGAMLFTSGLVLLLAQSFPLVLSPDMDPIVAVLRSNFWLSTHVTTITISYAAFSIAMVLGNIALIRAIFGRNMSFIAEFETHAYRAVQLGCFLLTVGIILGGVWADYSWGRFWGWDPKETWALVALLGYLAVLHARLVGWITSFGLAVTSILAFSLVIMAWYGVNFVLGAGLHSYGFGAGGVEYVFAFVGVHILFVIYITTVRYLRNRTTS